jgi:hypothetical protein
MVRLSQSHVMASGNTASRIASLIT